MLSPPPILCLSGIDCWWSQCVSVSIGGEAFVKKIFVTVTELTRIFLTILFVLILASLLFSSSREFTFTRIDLFLSLSLLFGTRIEGTIRRKSCFIRFIEKGLDLILFIQLIKLKKPRIIFKGWSRALKRINLPGDRDKIKKRDKVEEGEFVRSIRRARRSNSILGSRVTRHGDGSTFLPSFLEFPLCLGYLCARGWTAPSIDFETVFALTSGFNFCPVSASFGREKKGLDENHDRLTQIFRLVQIFIRLSAWLAPFVLSPFLSFSPPPSSFSFYF